MLKTNGYKNKLDSVKNRIETDKNGVTINFNISLSDSIYSILFFKLAHNVLLNAVLI